MASSDYLHGVHDGNLMI